MSIMNFSTTTDLLPHQIDAVAKLLPTRVGGLFAEMGTGKSRILIEIAKLRAAKGKVSRVVWFCPTSIKSTIVFEILRHTDCIPDDIHAFDDTTRSDTVPLDRFWYVVGIEGLGQSARIVAAFDKFLDDRAFVVVDESSYIKGPRAKRTQLVTHMSARARYRMAMTGTPLTQGVVDLYAQMYFLSPKILGYNSFYSFAANHLEYRVDRRTGKRTGQIVQAHNTHVLAKKVAPYVYQITKDECLDLPEKLFHCHGTTATAQQREYYEAAKNEFLDIEPDDVKDFDVFRLFSTLQAVSAGYHKGERLDSYRIAGLCDVLRTIRAPEKVVVWTKYRLALEDIRTALAAEYGEDAVQIFHGGLSAQEKDDNLAMWRASGRFLLATQASGGHGLTLVDANTAVFFANSFKFSERAQAEDRIHRIGQRRPCTYVDIVSNLGIDSRIGGALSNKEGTLQSFRDKLDLYRKLGLKAKIREAVMAL